MKWCFLCAFTRTESHSDHRPSISLWRWDRARRFQTAQWFITSWWLMFVAVIVHWNIGMRRHSYLSHCSCHTTLRPDWKYYVEVVTKQWEFELFKTFHHTNGYSIFLHLDPSHWAADVFYRYLFLFFVVSASTELLHGLKKTFCSAAMLRCDKLHLKYKYST